MTKKELIKKVALETECTQKDVTAIVEAVLAGITAALADGDEVALPGFGKFLIKDVPAKNVRNPRTGASIMAAAYKKVSFRVYDALKKAVQ